MGLHSIWNNYGSCVDRYVLIISGIANALDLTDRVLPRLQLSPECKLS